MTDQSGVPRWAIVILKWLLMLGLLGGIVYVALPQTLQLLDGAVQFDSGGDDDEANELETVEGTTDDQPTEDAEPVTGTALVVDQLASRSGAVSHTGPAPVPLGRGSDFAEELYLAFEPIEVDYPCLTSVVLRVMTTESDQSRLYAQPSQLTNLNSYTEGDPLPADSLIVGGGEAGATLDGNPGLLAWDVTEQYRVAATSVGADDPVVLALLPETDEEIVDPETDFRSVLQAMDTGEEQLARLEWSATPTCPDGSAPEADDEDVPDDGDAEGPALEEGDEESGPDEESGDGESPDDGAEDGGDGSEEDPGDAEAETQA